MADEGRLVQNGSRGKAAFVDLCQTYDGGIDHDRNFTTHAKLLKRQQAKIITNLRPTDGLDTYPEIVETFLQVLRVIE